MQTSHTSQHQKSGQYNLFEHQKRAVDFYLRLGGKAAVFYEMGLGKTLIALDSYKKLKQNNSSLQLLVLCPLSLIEGAWGEDIVKFTDFTWTNGHKKSKRPQYTDIYIYNYESLNSSRKYAEIVKLIEKGRWMCVLDESSRMKNHKAQTTKKLHRLRNSFAYRMIMSGTPAPNLETEYWAQMNFVNDVFHKSFYAFQRQYFHMQRGIHRMNEVPGSMSGLQFSELMRKGFKMCISDHNREVMMNSIKKHAIYAKKKDCMDLPEQIDEKMYLTMGPSQKKHYKSMKNDMIASIKEDSHIVAQTALTKLMKLRQITGGFAIAEDKETVALEQNPKLNELSSILEDAGDSQVIIWCQFRWEIEKIKEVLGDRAVCLYGATQDKQASIEAFKKGDAQYLIAHPRSAGHGLTFTNCSLQVFYSLDYSWEAYEQAKARTHRAGQKNPCTYIHMIMKGTIDEIILDALKKKKSNDELLYEIINGN